jgi:ABC-type multidrug transport system fused ATPase/permease subunit
MYCKFRTFRKAERGLFKHKETTARGFHTKFPSMIKRLSENLEEYFTYRQEKDIAVVTLKEGAKKIFMSSYYKRLIGMNKHIGIGSLIIILITFFLFIIALFVKGWTKELFLEAGVLLVSIKIIMMAQKNSDISNEISKDLEEIKKMIKAAK